MGRISRFLEFIRTKRGEDNVSDVKVDPGGGPNITVEYFSPSGDDSQPLPDDLVLSQEIPRTGGEAAVGIIDPVNAGKSQQGEKRIYARGGDGVSIVELWLKSDGSAVFSNENGSFQLLPNGNFNLNGVIIDTDGNITTPATVTAQTSVESPSIVADGNELAGHDHNYTWTDPGGSGTTGPNN